MKTKLYGCLAVVILAASAYTLIAISSWQIAEGYSVAFSSNEAAGIFRDVKGTIAFDENQTTISKFDVTIDVNSINTGNGLQNKHAKSDEWFDAAKYPSIRYSSQKIVKTAGGYSSTGELEMHGVKKPLTIPFTFQRTPKGGVFAGKFSVDRVDFGIGKPGGDVDEQIKIELNVPVTAK
jgi:polyisoprenoid-binding protein YceI